MGTTIINRGRGPEIAGTRIAVYDVLDYVQAGWHAAQIVGLFRLTPEEIHAALQYIDAHREEVMRQYQQILARHQHAQYAPAVVAKLARNRQKLQQKLAEIRARRPVEEPYVGDHGGS